MSRRQAADMVEDFTTTGAVLAGASNLGSEEIIQSLLDENQYLLRRLRSLRRENYRGFMYLLFVLGAMPLLWIVVRLLVRGP